jgi:hypothetical protein
MMNLNTFQGGAKNSPYRSSGLSKVMRKMISLVFLAAVATSVSNAAISETSYPLVTYKCNTEDDIITLTNSLLPDDEGPTFKYSDETGTYSPWDLVEISQSPSRARVVRTKKIIKHCTLSTGVYTVTLEPKVFNRNLSGTCGASISSAFTVSFDGFNLKERTAFEDYCRGNSPVITRVTVFGKTGDVKVKRIPRYKFTSTSSTKK